MPTESTKSSQSGNEIVSLAGGVGGAKMAHGFAQIIDPATYTVIVNTADDFDHLGLRICPDLDTVMYTLAGMANPVTGWGITNDTTNVLDAIRQRGGPNWFLIGDQDFATHILRTSSLQAGQTLTETTKSLCKSVDVPSLILPMTDDVVATEVLTAEGLLSFQDYFVRRQQQDDVLGISFRGAAEAMASPQALLAIDSAAVVVINPSNPVVSIGPILAVPGFESALRATTATRIAVSPIIGGKALKGPADRMLSSLGHDSSPLGVARMFQGLIDGIVIDNVDKDLSTAIEDLGINVLVNDAIMRDEADRARLAAEVLQFAASINRMPVTQ